MLFSFPRDFKGWLILIEILLLQEGNVFTEEEMHRTTFMSLHKHACSPRQLRPAEVVPETPAKNDETRHLPQNTDPSSFQATSYCFASSVNIMPIRNRRYVQRPLAV